MGLCMAFLSFSVNHRRKSVQKKGFSVLKPERQMNEDLVQRQRIVDQARATPWACDVQFAEVVDPKIARVSDAEKDAACVRWAAEMQAKADLRQMPEDLVQRQRIADQARAKPWASDMHFTTGVDPKAARASGAEKPAAGKAALAAQAAAARRQQEQEQQQLKPLQEYHHGVIQAQDKEFQLSLLHDQIKELLGRKDELLASAAPQQEQLEELQLWKACTGQRLERYGENPRLRSELQAIQNSWCLVQEHITQDGRPTTASRKATRLMRRLFK